MFITGADVVPDLRNHNRCPVIFLDQKFHSIVQHVFMGLGMGKLAEQQAAQDYLKIQKKFHK